MNRSARGIRTGAALLVLFISAVAPANADISSVIATSDKDAGGAYPFTGGSINPEGVAYITVGVNSPTPTAEFRSALEFSLAAVPIGATVHDASLALTLYRNVAFPNAEVHGYVGDGDVQTPDLLVLNLLSTFSVPGGSGFMTITIDATSFVQSLVNIGTGYAGFSIRGASPAFLIATRESTDESQRPRLTIDFTPAVTPEPGSLSLLGIGLAGMLGYGRWAGRRRRRPCPTR